MKKILLSLVLFFTCILTVNASTNKYDRNSHPNLGVNKDIEITEERKNYIMATPYVNADEKIYDFADILTVDEENILIGVINSYVNQTNMDMVILTTDLAYGDNEIASYSADFYDYNDFGLDFEHYSGIMLTINMNSYNRFYNIYTFGEAQLYYSYSRVEAILDSIYNYAVSGQYSNMFLTFVDESLRYHGLGIPKENIGAYIDDTGKIIYPFKLKLGAALLVSSGVTLILVLIFVRRNKMVKKATKAAEYLDNKQYLCNLRNDNLVNSRTTSYIRSSSSSGGGGGSSRGSSGRSFSSGGGRHF